MPTIDVSKFTPVRNESVIERLAAKYRFLEYALEHWIWHTVDLFPETSRHIESFERLVFGKVPIVQARPWMSIHPSGTLPHFAMFLWAVDAGHAPLLTLLSTQDTTLPLNAYVKILFEKYEDHLLNACRKGLTNVLRLLMGSFNDSIPDLSRLMDEAVAHGHDDLVEMLKNGDRRFCLMH
jgi:hypothetical protein